MDGRFASAWVIGLLIAGVLMIPTSAGTAPAPAGSAEGVITTVDAPSFGVSTAGGAVVRITTTADTRIINRQQTRLEEIKPADFVGVTAKREADGSLVAISINIFPPEYKGQFRESQFLMTSGNTMTNATVFQSVRRIDGRTLYLRFPDGTAVITVPKAAEVFRLTVMQAGQLRPGMRVVVRGGGNPDGSITASSVTVEGAAR